MRRGRGGKVSGRIGNTGTVNTHTHTGQQKRVEKENGLERKASLDSERQAVAVYQGHF